MNKSLITPTTLTRHRGLSLILTAGKARSEITELITELILLSPLFVVAASEWLPAYELPRKIRKRTVEIKEVVSRLRAVRTSTCFRLFDSLASIASQGEPILVLDLLHTFYKPDNPLDTRFRILRSCCHELERLAFARPLIVTVQELPVDGYEEFLSILRPIADQIIAFEQEPEPVLQPRLL